MTKEQYAKILEQGAYVEGNENAKIAWLEFSDLQCPYCAKLYSDGTPSAVKAKYGDDINIRFNHFPLDFHPNALPAAEVAECLAQQK
ncbi:MAG: DsbA family protein [Candidatus Peribacteria bacterium]|nr:DsbA family protein [Candidatus Peribacteria bacterium]